MFTGLVETTGKITAIFTQNNGLRIEVTPHQPFDDITLGDSIAVNGICLTATGIGQNRFTADVSKETVERSTIAELQPGSLVNLERAMGADHRFGGHIVSGHIDGVGTISGRRSDGNSTLIDVKLPAPLRRWVIEKGSIAIDGISLTIATCTDEGVRLAIIPHSLAQTTLRDVAPGHNVNIECDMLAKYVEKYVTGHLNQASNQEEDISFDVLAAHGFI